MRSYRTLAIALFAAIILGFWLKSLEHEQSILPVFNEIADFQFVDTQQQQFTKQNLLGSVSVVNFFFTSCPVRCPAIMTKIESLRNEISDPSMRFQFISVSVDPKNDTPEVLASYAQEKLKPATNWHLLTGTLPQIMKFSIESLKLGTAETPDLHSTRLVLIDKEARVRGYYQSQEQDDLDKLRRDMELLLQMPATVR